MITIGSVVRATCDHGCAGVKKGEIHTVTKIFYSEFSNATIFYPKGVKEPCIANGGFEMVVERAKND